MEVVGTVVFEQPSETQRNSAIIRYQAGPSEDPVLMETIWYVGEERTLVVNNERHTLRLVKVERLGEQDSACEFEIRGQQGRPPRFQVAIKKLE